MSRTRPTADPTPRHADADGEGGGSVSALARGLLVLRTVAEAGRALGNAELSAATGIPKATVSRLAGTLAAAGHLRQEPDTERYWLGPALLDLGNLYLRRFDLRQIARSHFAPLADATGCSIHLGIRAGADLLIIDSVRSRSAVIASQIDVGSRMSLVTSAAGRAYLAVAAADERADVLAALGPASRSRRRIEERLAEAYAEYEREGYATSFGEWHPQIHALGLALTGARGERYAVSCGGPGTLLSEDRLRADVAPRLMAARDAIAREAGSDDLKMKGV